MEIPRSLNPGFEETLHLIVRSDQVEIQDRFGFDSKEQPQRSADSAFVDSGDSAAGR